jgi:hypothetical protein
MGDLMNEFMKKKAISMLRMELIITLIYIGAWGIWGIMAIVDLNVAKIFFLGMSIYITLIIHYHVPLHKWNYSGSIQAIGIILICVLYDMAWISY